MDNKSFDITIPELFTRKFYGMSILANVLSLCGGFFLYHGQYSRLALTVLILIDITLAVELLFKPRIIEHRNAITNRYVVKVLVGMIAVLLTVFEIDNPVAMYIPPMLYMVYSAFNAIIKSKLISYASPVFLGTGFVVVMAYNVQKENIILYAFITLMMIMVVTLSRKLYVAKVTETASKLEFANSVGLIHDMVFSIMRHDIKNHLGAMQILSMPRYRENEELFLDTMEAIYKKITDTLDTTRMSSTATINLIDIAKDAATQGGKGILVINSVPISVVKANRSMLVPTLKNIIENSNEAAARKGFIPSIRIIVHRAKIIVEDDCGGFDVTMIHHGRSAKSGNGHGIFLRTITSPTIKKLFGFSVTVESIPGGTRHIINFS